MQIRLRAIFASLAAGATAGTDQLVIRDGASGVGTIIWQADLSVPANGGDRVQLSNLDIRATPGNSLTVEFVNGLGQARETVNGEGDIIPVGYPLFMS